MGPTPWTRRPACGSRHGSPGCLACAWPSQAVRLGTGSAPSWARWTSSPATPPGSRAALASAPTAPWPGAAPCTAASRDSARTAPTNTCRPRRDLLRRRPPRARRRRSASPPPRGHGAGDQPDARGHARRRHRPDGRDARPFHARPAPCRGRPSRPRGHGGATLPRPGHRDGAARRPRRSRREDAPGARHADDRRGGAASWRRAPAGAVPLRTAPAVPPGESAAASGTVFPLSARLVILALLRDHIFPLSSTSRSVESLKSRVKNVFTL